MRRAVRLCIVAAALSVATMAAAQGRRSAAPGFMPGMEGRGQAGNNDQPIQIDARSLEVRDKNKTATFIGDVKVVQGNTTMRCNTLVVFYGREIGISGQKPVVRASTRSGAVPDNQNIRRIEARGDVTVTSRDQSASGDLGVYDLRTKTITLSGNVVVTQGDNVIHGERVVVNTETGNAHVESAPGNPSGRVRALIIPNSRGKGGESNFMTIGPGPGR